MKLPCLLFFIPFFAIGQVSERPNVVLFMADDMGMGDTSAYQPTGKNLSTVRPTA